MSSDCSTGPSVKVEAVDMSNVQDRLTGREEKSLKYFNINSNNNFNINSIFGSCFFNLPAALLAAAWWHQT
jgi:hypothetical protein